eukprot:gene9509-19762_t
MSKASKTIPAYNPWENAAVWVMLSPPEGLWQEAKVLSHVRAEEVGSPWIFQVELLAGSKHEIKTAAIDKAELEFEWVKKRDENTSAYVNTTDMTSLAFLNEAEMIECMRHRFLAKKIYTNTGPILMAINPFERLPVYTTEAFEKYYTQTDSKMEPHVYQMSDRAYRKMFVDRFDPDKRENQTVLVNGESGAGKTESTKQVLKYLSLVSSNVASKLGLGSAAANVESQIVASNPITESFGNAKTSRNNNSSRFGKFIELGYSPDGYIEGATIRTYLLETVRISTQFKGERNYHIFYEIDAGLSVTEKQKYGLTSLKDFHFTNQSGEYNRHDDENDPDNYIRLRDAFTTLLIPMELQELIIQVVVGVLHLGNLTFTESAVAGEEAANFSPKVSGHVDHICQLLGISQDMLLTAVARRSVTIAGSEIQKTLNAEAAMFAKDTFAKLVYDLLFKWTVSQVNATLSANVSGESASFIGVLDIFGFEFFDKNSFEQLCINYTNEKLQDHFNFAIFKSEQEVYQQEGLKWTFVDYPDNSARLDLLEHKTTGIYALCDEQLKVPKCSDEKFAKSLYDKCGKHKFFSASKTEQSRHEFVVKHFACDVKYQATGFLDKNRSDIAKELNDCLSNSTNEVVRHLIVVDEKYGGSKHNGPVPPPSPSKQSATGRLAVVPRGASVGKKSASTVATQFSKQLTELVSKIRTTRSHFIRCIKPNNELKPCIFNQTMVLKQLRCGGALGAVQVFRAGFPNRMDFMSFVIRFGCISFTAGKNPMTKDLATFINEARRTGSDRSWMQAAAKLIDVVPLSECILNMIDKDIFEVMIPEAEVDLRTGLQMGKSQVFMRAEVYEHMERILFRTVNLVATRLQLRFKSWNLSRRKGGGGSAMKKILVHFSEHKRAQAVRLVHYIVVIQRRAKVYLSVKYRKRMIWLVTVLAAHYRGWKAREYVKKIKDNAATKIQALFRGYKLRIRLRRGRRLARLVQPLVRGWLVRSALARRAGRERENANRLRTLDDKVLASAKTTSSESIPLPSSQHVAKKNISETPLLDSPLTKGKGVHTNMTISSPVPAPSPPSEMTLKEMSRLQAQVQALETEAKLATITMQEKLVMVEQEKTARETEVVVMRDRLAKLEEEIDTVRDQSLKAESDKENVRSIASQTATELEAVRVRLAAANEENKGLRADVDQSKGDMMTLRSQMLTIEQELNRYKDETERSRHTITDLEIQLSIAEESAGKKGVVINTMQGQISVLEEERNCARVEAEHAKSSATGLREEIQGLESELSVLRDQMIRLKVESTSFRSEISIMEEERSNSKTAAAQARIENVQLCSKVSVMEEALTAFQRDLDAANEEILRANCYKNNVDKDLKDARTEIDQLKRDVKTQRRQTLLVEEEIAGMQAAMLQARAEGASLRSQLSIVQQERDEAKAVAVHAKTEVTAMQKSVTDAVEVKAAAHLKELLRLQDKVSLLEEERDLLRVEGAK